MAKFRTCIACRFNKGNGTFGCSDRAAFEAAVAGLRITSVKWRCASRVPLFAPGDPVFAKTVPYHQRHPEDDEPPKLEFPATVIWQRGPTSFVVFIDKRALPVGVEDPELFAFEPNGNGYCKIPLSRLRPREGEKRFVCPRCCEIDGKHLDECGWVDPSTAREPAPF